MVIEPLEIDIPALKRRVDALAQTLHVEEKRAEIGALEKASAVPGFWDDQEKAQSVMTTLNADKDAVAGYEEVAGGLDDLEALLELMDEAGEDESLSREAQATSDALTARIEELEVTSWFTGEFDASDAIITIMPGQGGLEAQDWTDMLFRMYLRYAEKKGWKVDIHDAPAGDTIGIDHATFTVHGHNAYGMLSSEQGVHRLVRISPTDIKKRRQTTFAGVTVVPAIPDDIDIDLRDEDVRVDVYRSSGPGGQSVNTTDSAVRLTHVPTGLVVTCQNEKSQHKNKDAAYSILRARLYELKRAERDAELEELRGPKADISWGSQIRNYVLYPYQMVKDVRTGIETGNVDAVLDGDIERFMIAFHRLKASKSA